MLNLIIKFILIGCICLAPALSLNSQAFDLNDLKSLKDKLKKSTEKVKKTEAKIDKAQGKMTEKEEIDVGAKLISGLLGAAPLVDNPALQNYVNDVGLWVASQTSRKKLPWSFGVIDSDGINAFAAPGGYIVLTMGLYRVLQNEAQLAAVLAHEIAHVVGKHHLKALQKTMKREFWSGAALSAVDDQNTRQTLEKMVNAGVQLYASGLDRTLEYDADLRGVVYAARAGYDPYALLDVLTTIDSINPDSAELSVLLNTHPATGDRLSKLAGRMDSGMAQFANGKLNLKRFLAISGDS